VGTVNREEFSGGAPTLGLHLQQIDTAALQRRINALTAAPCLTTQQDCGS